MSFYQDSHFAVDENLSLVHEKQFAQLAEPGVWGTGAQRLSIAQETRQSCFEEGLLEKPDHDQSSQHSKLPDVARNLIKKLATSPKDFLEDSYTAAINGGLSDEEYVEIVGIVSRVTNMDIFARGIGVDLRRLPAPKEGEPSRNRPPEAKKQHAWVPTIPRHPEGGDIAEELFGPGPKGYIIRALSLVPEETRMHRELENIQYLPVKNIMIPDYQHHEGLTRAQSETVAGRVSAFNECFF